jgi:glyoxylase-like metal-dependent hydrolase (beta-lactamase superfamily II)
MAPVTIAVDRYELGPLETNCFVVRRERGAEEAIVVDPGGDPTQLRLELARMRAAVVAILLTHGHWDHVLGVAELAESSGAPIYIGAAEVPELEGGLAEWMGVPSAPSFEPDTLLEGGETLSLAGLEIEVVSVPGHRPGHMAYATDGCLFSGDVLFAGSVGRTDFPGGDWDTLLASIELLASRFPPETVVYSGHGPETTIGAELRSNPFLSELFPE